MRRCEESRYLHHVPIHPPDAARNALIDFSGFRLRRKEIQCGFYWNPAISVEIKLTHTVYTLLISDRSAAYQMSHFYTDYRQDVVRTVT